MLIKKIAISTALVLLIVTPLVYFTNILASIPYLGPILAKDFWKALASNPETTGPAGVPIIIFAGPACIIFMIFWNLWVQRNMREIILAVAARAADIHKWLGTWAQNTEQQPAGDIETLGLRAKKLFKKLDRLLSLEDRENRRLWYSLYLAVFYTFNAPKLSAFKEVKVEPPPDVWPRPDEARHGLDRRNRKLLENAIAFSGDFIDGAKAYTGLQFMLHTVVGSSFGIVLSVLLGSVLVLALVQNLSIWIGPFFAALMLSLILGLVAGYCWYRICKTKGKKTEMPTEQTADNNVPSAAIES